MYNRTIESNLDNKQQHNRNMKAASADRLGKNSEWKRKHGKTNTCASGSMSRKAKTLLDSRQRDWQAMVAQAKPNVSYDGYHKPGSTKVPH